MRDFYYLSTAESEEISHHMGNAVMIIASRRRREGLDIDLRPIESQLERVRAGIVEPISLVIDSNKLSSACIVDEVCYEQAVRINDAIQQVMLPFGAVRRPQLNESGVNYAYC